MIAGKFFVTPHAVEQFRKRIAPWMSYEQALGVIIKELRSADDFRPTRNGKAIYVRIRGEWSFRAIIREGHKCPAVVTILRGGKRRKQA